MKKKLFALARSFCRLISCFLWQLIWLIPVGIFYFYGKLTFPSLIERKFALDQFQDRLISLEHFSATMKDNVSFTNPSALFQYLSAQLTKFSVSAKLNTLEMTSDILQSLCLLGLNIFVIIALIYAFMRSFRLYRSKTEIYDTAHSVVDLLAPQLNLLHQEVLALQDELQTLKSSKHLNEKP